MRREGRKRRNEMKMICIRWSQKRKKTTLKKVEEGKEQQRRGQKKRKAKIKRKEDRRYEELRGVEKSR